MKEGSVHVFAPGKANLENAVEDVKIYDGTSTVDVKATLVDAQVKGITPTTETKDEIKLFQEIVFGGYDSKLKNVQGEEEKQNMTFAPKNLSTVSNLREDLKTNYKIEEVEMGVPLTIQKRTLKLGVRGVSRGFRDLKYVYKNEEGTKTEGKDPNGLNLVFATGFVNGQDEDKLKVEGFKFPKVVDTTATDLTEENVKEKDTAEYGKHTGALVLQEEDQITNPTNNYKFDLTATGTLEITGEKNAAGYLSVDNINSTHAYEAGGKRYYGRYYGENARIRFSETGGYNRVYCVNGDSETDATDVTDLGLEIKENNDINRSFYLTKEDESGKVLAKTQDFKLQFIYDAEPPECDITFDKDTKNVVRNIEQAVTFGFYKKDTIEANVTLSDTQSGVNEMSYLVVNTSEDKNHYWELLTTEEDYETALSKVKFESGEGLKTSGKENSWTIKNIGKLKGGEDLECNNYIVFVKAEDNVGNVKIYGSNGVVLENNTQDISVTYKETPCGLLYGKCRFAYASIRKWICLLRTHTDGISGV